MGKNERTLQQQRALKEKIKEEGAVQLPCRKCDEAKKVRDFAEKNPQVRLKPMARKEIEEGDGVVNKRLNLTGVVVGFTFLGRLKIIVDDVGFRMYNPEGWEIDENYGEKRLQVRETRLNPDQRSTKELH